MSDKNYQKQWRDSHPDYKEQWAKKHPGYFEKKSQENKERGKAQKRLLYYFAKIAVLEHYGGGKLACIKCGFTDIRALSLDHIHGGGNRERKKRKMEHKRVLTGKALYRHLYINNLPAGDFQTLCMNCQFIKKDTEGERNNWYRT